MTLQKLKPDKTTNGRLRNSNNFGSEKKLKALLFREKMHSIMNHHSNMAQIP